MAILLKVSAIFLSVILFMGYAWWDRGYLTFIEKAFMLSSAYGLLAIGVVPFKYLRIRRFRLMLIVVLLIGLTQSLSGIYKAIATPIAADTSAVAINIIIIVVLCLGVFEIVKKKGDKEHKEVGDKTKKGVGDK